MTPDGKRKRGRPKATWGMTVEQVKKGKRGRSKATWRMMVEQVKKG